MSVSGPKGSEVEPVAKRQRAATTGSGSDAAGAQSKAALLAKLGRLSAGITAKATVAKKTATLAKKKSKKAAVATD